MAASETNTTLLFDAVRKHGGDAALRALRSAYGGTSVRIPVPDKVSLRSALAKAVGLDIAISVSKELSVLGADGGYLGKFEINVPLGSQSINQRLKGRIAELLSAGKRPRAIALELGCSERMVWRHKKQIREERPLACGVGR